MTPAQYPLVVRLPSMSRVVLDTADAVWADLDVDISGQLIR
ncbi:MAG: hypothetical protein ACRDRU_07580 [Pseudonocardiaceae bacterium]